MYLCSVPIGAHSVNAEPTFRWWFRGCLMSPPLSANHHPRMFDLKTSARAHETIRYTQRSYKEVSTNQPQPQGTSPYDSSKSHHYRHHAVYSIRVLKAERRRAEEILFDSKSDYSGSQICSSNTGWVSIQVTERRSILHLGAQWSNPRICRGDDERRRLYVCFDQDSLRWGRLGCWTTHCHQSRRPPRY